MTKVYIDTRDLTHTANNYVRIYVARLIKYRYTMADEWVYTKVVAAM